eukprot:5540678-Pyramimonas_sp.AAC.1
MLRPLSSDANQRRRCSWYGYLRPRVQSCNMLRPHGQFLYRRHNEKRLGTVYTPALGSSIQVVAARSTTLPMQRSAWQLF